MSCAPLNAILGFSEVMKGEIFGPHGVPAYKDYAADTSIIPACTF